MDATCPFCFRKYKLFIPKGGDGSASKLRRHYRTISVIDPGLGIMGNKPGKKVVCPGSYLLITSERESQP